MGYHFKLLPKILLGIECVSFIDACWCWCLLASTGFDGIGWWVLGSAHAVDWHLFAIFFLDAAWLEDLNQCWFKAWADSSGISVSPIKAHRRQQTPVSTNLNERTRCSKLFLMKSLKWYQTVNSSNAS